MLSKSSRIYVAGHTGLVGSAIWHSLQRHGFTDLVGKTHQELDLLNPNAVASFFDEEKPDVVALAAAHVGGILANSQHRADFIYLNLQIQQNVIGESFRHQVKKLLFLGSSCIYPRNAAQPITENELLTSELEYTNEPYAIAKIAGLKLCESFNLQYGTNYIAVMPTNLYGPNDNFHLEHSHVLPAMMRKLYLAKCLEDNNFEPIRKDLAARPIDGVSATDTPQHIIDVLGKYGISSKQVTLWGTGTPMREFLWSEDLADACVHVLENVNFTDLCNMHQSEIRNCHINVGTGIEISLQELAEKIKLCVGFTGELRWDSSKPDGVMRKCTDVSKIHGLGWRHTIDIDEGISKLFSWYKSSILSF